MNCDLSCACATARRASRQLTQIYDAHLRAAGIEASQFAMLAVLDKLPGASQSVIVRALDMEKTTLSRNLRLLHSKGWITLAPPVEDARVKGYRLTNAGADRYAAAKPAWKRAQDEIQSAMSADEWQSMWSTFGAITRAAHAIGRNSGERNYGEDTHRTRGPARSTGRSREGKK